MITYGPYTRKDGRKHVVHFNPETKQRSTQSYPRYLMEQYLGRKLEAWEEVDHINNDCTDDRIENYQLLTRNENITKSAQPAETYTFVCPACGKEATKMMKNVRGNFKKGKAGPYCSRQCAGKMHN